MVSLSNHEVVAPEPPLAHPWFDKLTMRLLSSETLGGDLDPGIVSPQVKAQDP